MTRGLILLVAAALALLAAALVPGFAPGWLSAFVFLSMVPIGCLALLLVNGVSGGRWGSEMAPVLVPVARTLPLFLLAFVPVLLWRTSIYDWPRGVPADVARFYLNPPLFAWRGIAALAIWSAMAWGNAWRTPPRAAIALVIHGALLTFIPPDWIMTLRPGWDSAGFGLGFGIEQIFVALGCVALLAPQGDGRPSRDLSGMMLSALLGTVYFFYMQFIITWYGNIPKKVAWFAARTDGAWPTVMFAAFLLAAVIPFLAVLNPAMRRHAAAQRVLGGCVLAGVGLHVAWMTMPVFGTRSIAPGFLSALALAFILLALRPVLQPVRQHG